jgi:AcrR family transcriptional regulator
VPTTTGKYDARQREELLGAAWEVAAKEGLAACTYRRVAAEAGTSTTPVIRQFPNRKALLVALFGKFASDSGEALEVVDADGAPLDALIAEGLEVLADGPQAAARRRVGLDLGFEGRSEATIRKRVRAREHDRLARWSGLVEKGCTAGDFRTDRPAGELVDQLLSLLDGLVFATTIYPDRLPPAHVSALWDRGCRRLVSPGISPGVDQRLVIPDGEASRSLGAADPDLTKRQKLLAVAFHVTARDGLSGLSFRALAREAGTSTTPFTYAFGTRERLLSEMVRFTWEGIFAVRELASRIPSPVDRFFAEWSAEFSDDPGQADRERVYYEFHHQALIDPVLAGLLLDGDAEGFEAGVALVGAGQEQGLVRADLSASDLVDTLYAVADGIGLRRVILGEKRPAGYRVSLWEDAGRRILAQ